MIVFFYTQWCGQCIELLPELSNMIGSFNQHSSMFYKIDSESNQESFKKYKIRGFPTIVAFKDGSTKEYTGKLGVDQVTRWISKQLQNSNVSNEVKLDDVLHNSVEL